MYSKMDNTSNAQHISGGESAPGSPVPLVQNVDIQDEKLVFTLTVTVFMTRARSNAQWEGIDFGTRILPALKQICERKEYEVEFDDKDLVRSLSNAYYMQVTRAREYLKKSYRSKSGKRNVGNSFNLFVTKGKFVPFNVRDREALAQERERRKRAEELAESRKAIIERKDEELEFLADEIAGLYEELDLKDQVIERLELDLRVAQSVIDSQGRSRELSRYNLQSVIVGNERNLGAAKAEISEALASWKAEKENYTKVCENLANENARLRCDIERRENADRESLRLLDEEFNAEKAASEGQEKLAVMRQVFVYLRDTFGVSDSAYREIYGYFRIFGDLPSPHQVREERALQNYLFGSDSINVRPTPGNTKGHQVSPRQVIINEVKAGLKNGAYTLVGNRIKEIVLVKNGVCTCG